MIRFSWNLKKARPAIGHSRARLVAKARQALEITANEIVSDAKGILDIIYTDRGPHTPWQVSGALRDSIAYSMDSDPTDPKVIARATIYSDLVYSMRRHYENQAHPTARFYLTNALELNKDTFIRRLEKLLKRP
jgi:hypothetical protein